MNGIGPPLWEAVNWSGGQVGPLVMGLHMWVHGDLTDTEMQLLYWSFKEYRDSLKPDTDHKKGVGEDLKSIRAEETKADDDGHKDTTSV